jgi:hypothetical protein
LPSSNISQAGHALVSLPAQARWRCVNAPHLVALVRAGATFIDGKLIERPGADSQPEAA